MNLLPGVRGLGKGDGQTAHFPKEACPVVPSRAFMRACRQAGSITFPQVREINYRSFYLYIYRTGDRFTTKGGTVSPQHRDRFTTGGGTVSPGITGAIHSPSVDNFDHSSFVFSPTKPRSEVPDRGGGTVSPHLGHALWVCFGHPAHAWGDRFTTGLIEKRWRARSAAGLRVLRPYRPAPARDRPLRSCVRRL